MNTMLCKYPAMSFKLFLTTNTGSVFKRPKFNLNLKEAEELTDPESVVRGRL